MSPCQRRSSGAYTDPLAYAGSVVISRRRAANDNRPARDGGGWVRVPARAAAFALAGAIALGSAAHMAVRLLAG